MRLVPVLLVALVAPVRADPGALEGTFERDGCRLVVERAGEGPYRVAASGGPDGARQGEGTLRDGVLAVTWAVAPTQGIVGLGEPAPAAAAPEARALRLVSLDGRLGLDAADGGAPLRRAETGRWWRLEAAVRRDLVGPLQVLSAQPWRREGFERWYARRYQGTPVEPRHALAEHVFEAISRGERVTLLALHAKMTRDGVWRHVGPIRHLGGDGAMLFQPTLEQVGLRRALEATGFGDWWWASRGNPWGVRSRFRGVQLHFRGSRDAYVNVHVDFVNPGDPEDGRVTGAWAELGLAMQHADVDLRGWARNHTPERLLRELGAAGITVRVPE